MEYMNRFLSSGDGVVTHEELSKIHNSSDDGSMARRITITRLRKKIKKLGYEIVSAGKLGYVLKHNT